MLHILQKKDVPTLLGKGNWLSVKLVIDNYIGGVPAYEDQKITQTIFEYLDKGLCITGYVGFTQIITGFLHDKMVSWDIQESDYSMVKEDKSVIKRALVGGLLLGPAGAIVGGMSGLKDSEKKTYNAPYPYRLTINCLMKEQNIVGQWYLSNNEKKIAEMFFNKHYPIKI